MLDLHIVFFAILVDAGEPSGDAGEIGDITSAFIKEGPVHLDAPFLSDVTHDVEVGKDLFAAGFRGELAGPLPELGGSHSHFGNKAIGLHIGGGQSRVEVV